jgi:hypothetical protein
MELTTESGLLLDLDGFDDVELVALSALLPGSTITSLSRIIRTPAIVTLTSTTSAGLVRTVQTSAAHALTGSTTTSLFVGLVGTDLLSIDQVILVPAVTVGSVDIRMPLDANIFVLAPAGN